MQNNNKCSLKAQQNILAKLLVVSRSHTVDLQSVLKYELSAIPLSLFYPDGAMRKTMKSQLL